ncbi:hypothetical protein SARC_17117, partial [Sphaeroforma arctica JP610]
IHRDTGGGVACARPIGRLYRDHQATAAARTDRCHCQCGTRGQSQDQTQAWVQPGRVPEEVDKEGVGMETRGQGGSHITRQPNAEPEVSG